MKFSESWLRELVDPPLPTEELIEQFTMAGLEVDGFEPVAGAFSGVVVGEILKVEAHPNADRLVVCRVLGSQGQCQVVCGAPNARAGIKVPFAQTGAKLGDFEIKKVKLRGVESEGMLCSEQELGISENHAGLMELPEDAPAGGDIRNCLKLDDNVIDLDLTPNRSDCLGLIGLARETGLLNELDVSYPDVGITQPEIEDSFPVELKNPAQCPRFVGRVIRNIDINAESPLWMREKLRRCGIRSIDPVVDVTNYIMLELNQPMHAYDLNQLTDKIVVRQSGAGESIVLLDGREIDLQENTVLITDGSGPIGMGGVMGGLSTAVTGHSTDIFLESAFFTPLSIAGQARTYGMNTDAAHRFERGVDWQGQQAAIERATGLLLAITGGEPGPVIDTVSAEHLPDMPQITLRLSRIVKLLGISIDGDRIEGMLSRLEFEFTRSKSDKTDTSWLVSAPSHRFDIAIEADLIEEISRIYGYNTLPVRTPVSSLEMPELPEGEVPLNRIRDQLVTRGYQEAITYSFVDPELEKLVNPEIKPVELANPLSSEMSVMRTTLWTGLLRSLIYNLNRQQTRVRLFETGLRFEELPHTARDLELKPLELGDILQEKSIAGVACGSRHEENWSNDSQDIDFYDVKGDLESILELTGEEFEFSPGSHPVLQRGQSAEIRTAGKVVGQVGLMNPGIQKALDIKIPVFLFELKTEFLVTRKVPKASTLSRFPESRRDIAIVVNRGVEAMQVRKCVESVSDGTLTNLKLFDVYQGKGIDPNRKSLALGLTFRHQSRNLTDQEINDSVNKIVASLEADFGASLRN